MTIHSATNPSAGEIAAIVATVHLENSGQGSACGSAGSLVPDTRRAASSSASGSAASLLAKTARFGRLVSVFSSGEPAGAGGGVIGSTAGAGTGTTSRRGSTADKTGSAMSTAMPTAQATCRVAAEAPRMSRVTMKIAMRSSAPLAPASIIVGIQLTKRSILPSLRLGLTDPIREPLEFSGGEIGIRHLHECYERLLGRPIKERVHEVLERGEPGFLGGDRRQIDITGPVLFVLHEALVLEDAKGGAHRRVARRVGHALHDFVDGGFAALVERVHDLALSAGELDLR